MKKKNKNNVITRADFLRTQIHVGVRFTECVQQFVGHVLTSAVDCIHAPVVQFGRPAATQQTQHYHNRTLGRIQWDGSRGPGLPLTEDLPRNTVRVLFLAPDMFVYAKEPGSYFVF